jgi:hypothetical protein
VSRVAQLEQRRRTLLARCQAQRIELEWRVEQVRQFPRHWLRARTAGAAGAAALGAGRHPLAWIATVGGLMLLGRTREVLTLMVWARSALTLVSRATQVLSLLGALRKAR